MAKKKSNSGKLCGFLGVSMYYEKEPLGEPLRMIAIKEKSKESPLQMDL